ncbi:hypothetical protein ISF_09691 [Cordyceps fumosorosea ARSEF 2679]|uniref:Uncharacterized protein n=1 Tax=Cordyceps fumosorosea (strain ARSEF 2679) TaxID=1081104 RepID=A0A162HSS6_CORFA|nr:hypothetical protein ISF_09691 [Cordyceps fumosorosea ARSEF 2679]OAA42775.1 hypothetical protein ISF_09691 [Cordyceps fumosorosea ARSEF 2679]
MECDGSDDETTALLAITKAGQRRISFCQLLATRLPAESRFINQTNDEDATSNATDENERFRSALGIFFHESIPDSIFDTNDGLFQRGKEAIIQHLHSIDILSPPTQYDTCDLANKLLDYQHSLVWPNEGDHGRIFTRNDITLEPNRTQMTTKEAAGMLKILATRQPSQTYHHAAQKQPTHESAHTQPFASIMTPHPDSLINRPPETDVSTDPNSSTSLMTPDAFQTACQAGISMDPGCYTGFTGMSPDAYQTSSQAGVSMDPNCYTGFTRMSPAAYQTGSQAGVSMDPSCYTGFTGMSPGAYQTGSQAGVSMDPSCYTGFTGMSNSPAVLMPQAAFQAGVSIHHNTSIGLMPQEMHHSSEGYANDSGGNAGSEPLRNRCHINEHPQQFIGHVVPPGGGHG